MPSNRSRATPKRSRRLVWLGCVLLAVVALFTILELTNTTNFIRHDTASTARNTGPTEEEQRQQAQDFADTKKDAIENPTPSTPPPAADSSAISLSAQQLANGTVIVSADLGSIANGTCKLQIQNGANTTSQTAEVLYQPQSSSCAGFSIPVSSVGTGTWSLTLTVTSGGTTATKTLSVEVE